MTYYVNANADLSGDGSQSKPFKTINEAAALAVAGDQVIVAPGVYREWVNPVNGGSEDKRIVYKSVEPLGAHITGAEPLTGWTQVKGNVYTARVSNKIFGDYNPSGKLAVAFPRSVGQLPMTYRHYNTEESI